MFPKHARDGVHTVRLADAMSHMEVTPRLRRVSLGQEKTVPNFQDGDLGEIQVRSMGFTYYLEESNDF